MRIQAALRGRAAAGRTGSSPGPCCCPPRTLMPPRQLLKRQHYQKLDLPGSRKLRRCGGRLRTLRPVAAGDQAGQNIRREGSSGGSGTGFRRTSNAYGMLYGNYGQQPPAPQQQSIQKGESGSSNSSSSSSSSNGSSTIKPSTLRIHYFRKDGRYAGWGLHVWGDAAIEEVRWESPLQPQGFDSFGTFWDIPLYPESEWVRFIIHKGDDTDRGEMNVEIPAVASGRSTIAEVWHVAGKDGVHTRPPDLDKIPFGDLKRAAGHWLDRNTMLWRVPYEDKETGAPRKFLLHGSQKAGITAENQFVGGSEDVVALEPLGTDLPDHVRAVAPHLQGCTVLMVPELPTDYIAQLVQGQVVVSCHTEDGAAIEASGVQTEGVIDELFAYEGPLGARILPEGVEVSVWAPTAQSVVLLLWDGPQGGAAKEVPMEADRESGVWTASGPASWKGKYYNYRVTVYSPWTQLVESSESTDPYSRSLSTDGLRSQIVDPFSKELLPDGWGASTSPPLGPGKFADMAIYELHIRDFSASDETVPDALRGKYRAFCQEGSAGVSHLRRLAEGGITHLHLLPAYDFGSVPEREDDRTPAPPKAKLRKFAPDSSEQQEAVMEVAEDDAYNWGYDPVHWGVPEGSYATETDGPSRLLEFREMVAALHGIGLRVVLDVVYNHTFQAGGRKYSVLDKLVPGYYHRRGEAGNLLHSTCCNNTASEHLMCERLIVDDVVYWARAFKVDGFRFDIMGHILTRTMKRIRDTLRRLTLEADGVDGSSMYLYGEAWDFAEMACNQRGRNACQLNIAGLGIGSFNDRFRDAVMGGGPFMDPRQQGVATGLSTDMRIDVDQGGCLDQLEKLLEYSDWLRLSLVGALRDYTLVNRFGQRVRGVQVLYGAVPAAYTLEPWEAVNYAACHDNETLYDQVVLKCRINLPLPDRLRMYHMALAFVALGQAVPFFHAGDDILRSKSLDRDSFNSGDWFNRIDWSMKDNNFGAGLPPAQKNSSNWPIHRPLLADGSFAPSPQQISDAHELFLKLLRIRGSTGLLHLPNGLAVKNQVIFHNTGPAQIPGVISMEIISGDLLEAVECSREELNEEPYYCQTFKRLVVVFNTRPNSYSCSWPLDCKALELHPVLVESLDPVVRTECLLDSMNRTLEVPSRTVAVFVESRAPPYEAPPREYLEAKAKAEAAEAAAAAEAAEAAAAAAEAAAEKEDEKEEEAEEPESAAPGSEEEEGVEEETEGDSPVSPPTPPSSK